MRAAPEVTRLSEQGEATLAELLGRYGLTLVCLPPGEAIPGSYWGEPEAGLVGARVFARPDTPVHSVLHEACHYLCMSPQRRQALHTDAGGDYDEENCVCYLQLVLAQSLPGYGRTRMAADMDAWGYSFRLGSTLAWFEKDAQDARATLRDWGLLDTQDRPTWRLRGDIHENRAGASA